MGLRTGANSMQKRKVLTLPGLEPQSLGRPASSQSQLTISCIYNASDNSCRFRTEPHGFLPNVKCLLMYRVIQKYGHNFNWLYFLNYVLHLNSVNYI
jgi:hypothetical protein